MNVTLQSNFLPSPTQLYLRGWILWTSIWLIAQIQFEGGISGFSLSLVVVFSLLFILGSKLALLIDRSFIAKSTSVAPRLNYIFCLRIFATIGISGGLAYLFLHDSGSLFSTTDIASFRETRNALDSGLRFQDISTPMLCLGYVSFLASFAVRDKIDRRTWQLSIFALLFFLFRLYSTGGRTSIPILLFSLYIIRRTNRRNVDSETSKKTIWNKFRNALLGVLIITIFTLYTNFLLIGRLRQQGFSSLYSYVQYFQNSRQIKLPNYVSEILSRNESNISNIIVFLSLILFYYVVHGVFEFSRTIDWISETNPALGYGEVLFGSVGILIRKIFTETPSAISQAPSYGRYTTFFGSNVLDFGFLGAGIAVLIFGFLTSRWFLEAKQGKDPAATVRYAAICPAIFYVPFFDCIGGGFGLYILLSALLFYSLTKGSNLLGRAEIRRPKVHDAKSD